MSEYEDEGTPINWDNPFKQIRSSEADDITLRFLENGRVVQMEDEKGNTYDQFRWKCMRTDIPEEDEVEYMTSSKLLINDLKLEMPLKGNEFQIIRAGTGFQTKYKVKKI